VADTYTSVVVAPDARAQTKPARKPRRRRDQLILDALEKLLAKTALRDLGVEEIAETAGITRTRFYFYFKSKHEAYAALLQRIADEAFDLSGLPGGWFSRPPEVRPRDALLESTRRVQELWWQHRAVLREAADLWNAVPEVREHWLKVMDGLVGKTRAVIERDRELGIAPPGPDARSLAHSLIWYGERTQFLGFIDAPGALTVDELIEVGTCVWMRAIYLADDPDPG
jgi:TetR/AcrR family transcriptional regulator, ethionamide resistance regulator